MRQETKTQELKPYPSCLRPEAVDLGWAQKQLIESQHRAEAGESSVQSAAKLQTS